jgi:hypothetical protein
MDTEKRCLSPEYLKTFVFLSDFFCASTSNSSHHKIAQQFDSNLLNFSFEKKWGEFFKLFLNCLRESVSKLVCDWEGLGGRGGEEVHDDSIKK